MPPRSPHEVETLLAPGRRLVRFDAIEAELTRTKDRLALLRDDGFRQRLFRALDLRLAEHGDGGVLSLDVFDTLLLRDGSSELRRFVEIGARMAAHAGRGIEPVDAFLARHLGTQASYRAGPRVDGCGEGSLTEIHLTAARLLGLPDGVAEDFIAIELDYEATRLVPNPLLMEYLARHRARGGKVVLISDMYMHAPQIADLLSRCGIGREIWDALFSSADTKVSKASGGIFARVPDVAGAGHVLHVGDSLRGDFAQPRAAGWDSLLLPIPQALLARRAQDHRACEADLLRSHGIRLGAGSVA
ncbi:HAD family hydrolase [Roseicyclus sp.]|uniref:HAD family hydrolase n=1 Tax=Roseicyclus sp. TaxID=1914329 RepID=UPI003F9FBA46